MRHYSNVFKRVQAWVLIVAMLLPLLNCGLLLGVFAEDEPDAELTDGQIVANNYDMTDAEKALLSSGLLVGDTHSIYYPTDNDELVTVDQENKKITAKSYPNGDGNEWIPVSADIVAGGASKETVNLVDGKGAYTYDGNAFSVRVLYRLEMTIDAETQTALLNAAKHLDQGLKNLSEINGAHSILQILEMTDKVLDSDGDRIKDLSPMEVLTRLASAEGLPLWYEDEDGNYYRITTAKWGATASFANAVANLNEQLSRNGGKLDLSVVLDEYNRSTIKTQYLLSDRCEALRESLDSTYADITAVYDKITGTAMASIISALSSFAGQLDNWRKAVAPAKDDAWAIVDAGIIKPGMTDLEWAALDSLVADIDTISANTAKNPLVVAEKTVQVNMSMFNVTVNVQLKVAGTQADKLVAVNEATKTGVVTLVKGATEAEIKAAVAGIGIEAAATAAWSQYGYENGQFDVEYSDLPDTLTEDTTYTITYSPKYYTITYNYGASTEAPYGFNMVLPVCNVANRVYDYTVNGDSFYQGAIITIKGDTNITRTEGKAYDLSLALSKMVSNVYFGDNADASAILNSGALNVGKDMLNIRTPEKTLTLNAGVLTAAEYASNYAGLVWVPTTYKLVGGADNGVTGDIVSGQANLVGKSYEQVEVSYELALSNFANADILGLVNLPYELYQEAEGQLSALNRFAGLSSSLSSLNRTMISMLGGLVDTAPIDDGIKVEFRAVIDGILENCMDTDGSLKLYNLIKGYENGGLAYYYTNSAAFLKELDLLSGYLHEMVETDEKVAALTVLIAQAGDMAAGYESKILDAESKMAAIKADLKAPNAAIDLSSKNLAVLTTALTTANGASFKKYNALPAKFALTRTVSIQAADKQVATIVLFAPDGEKIEVTKVFDLGVKLTASDIAALKAMVEAAVASMNVPAFFYNTDYDADQLLVGFEGKDPSEVNLAYEWTAKTFTVQVPGAANQTISIDDLTIDLPAAESFGVRYEYTIGSKTGLTGTYTFTLAEVEALFVDGSYTVSRTEIDMNEEDLINFVNKLNDAVEGNVIKFALVKGANGYSVIMKVDAAQPGALAGAAQGMAMGFVQSGYSYIGLDEGGVLADNQISIQAIIDAIMASGFNTRDLVKVINANGTVNNMAMPGAVLAGDMNVAGGKLIETTMSVGNSKADSQKLGFYITLGSAADQIVEIRNLLAGRVSNYLQVVCVDGKATVQMTLPEKAYQAYLAALLVSGELDVRNINAANGEIAIGFIKDFINPMFVGDVTLETVNNTLNAFGYDLDLAEYENLYAKLCEQYKKTDVQYDEKSGHATRTFSIKSLVDKMNIPSSLAGMIKEYETGITVTAAVSVENLANEYEALFVDVRAAGATNKIGLTKDLSAKLKDLSGASIIVLMSDVTGDLVLPYTTVLNLNGFTVNGSVKCTGKVTIVDSSLMETEIGRVTGTVSGNATILGGQYDSKDIDAFIKAGYVQNENGVVGNEFYSFVKDANGDITVQIDAGIAATDAMPDVKSLVIDLAVDMLFNGYTTNSLYIDNHKVYEMVMEDFLGIYTGEDRLNTLVHNVLNMVDSKELGAIVNQLAADLTNFEALQNAILNDQPIISYPMTTGDWSVALEHVIDGDYLTISVTTSNVENRNLHIKFVGTQEDKDLLADLMGALKDTTDVDIKVDLDHGFASSDDKHLVLDWNGSAKINVNFSNNYDYAVMFSVLLADGNTGATRKNLVNAIKTYYATGEISELMVAFNAVTTAEAIKAVKNIYKNDTFGAMLDNLGLADVVYADVADLEYVFDTYAKLAAAALRKTDIVGGNRTLGSFYNKALGGYGFTRSNLDKSFSKELFKGYSVAMNVAIDEVTVVINIFGDAAPYVVDYTELKNAIDQAEGLDADMYALNTWNAMQAVLANAKALLNNASKQEQVDDMVAELNAAIDALVDIAVLKVAIEQAKGLNPDDYTEDSWNALWVILVEAEKLLTNAPDQATVNEMTALLTAAIDDLDEVQEPDIEELDYSVLVELIRQVESLDPAEYTEDSWAVVYALYEQAVALLNNAETQAEIDALVADLAAAIANLVPATIEDVFVPEIEEHEEYLKGVKLHEDDIHIILDAHGNGLNAADLQQILKIEGSPEYTFTVESVEDKGGLVYTGAKIVISIYNKNGIKIGEREFYAVVLGDIDGDGRATAKDANFMAIYYTSPEADILNGTQILAADTDQDGDTDAKDALVISVKYVDWDNYNTFVGA